MPAPSDWKRVHGIEDIIALILDVEDEARVIRAHAWRQGSWEEVFRSALTILAICAKARSLAAEKWQTAIEDARERHS